MALSDYLQRVKYLKDDYSDEILSTILHSRDQISGPKFKVRKAWFYCVGSVLASGVRNSYLPPEYINTFLEFHQRNKDSDFHHRDTTREDIDYANKILDDIINELSSKI